MAAALARVASQDLSTWGDRKLDGWIKRGHTAAGAHSKSYEQASAITGLLLLERKRRVPKGQWEVWLGKHFNGSTKTARRYMEKAESLGVVAVTDDRYDEPWTFDELGLRDQLEQGQTITVHLRNHARLIDWATEEDLFVRIDRNTRWGNPFLLDDDGTRDIVIALYRDIYLPHKPSLLERIGELQGKALGCWCAPEPCHGDVLIELAG